MKSRYLIAAAHSGAGKTTVTLGLLRAFRDRGYTLQPFKCGPDYLDPKHHVAAAGRKSINLDKHMMSTTHIRQLYEEYGADADICITEGVMGLFDGAPKMEGSSADLAQMLQMPVILVVNAKAMAYSAAAILYGLKNFCKELSIAGVIFNFVERESHYHLLRQACEDVGVTALGYLPTHPAMAIPSRYLGLDASSDSRMQTTIAEAAAHIEKHIDLELLLELTKVSVPPPSYPGSRASRQVPSHQRKVLVAEDAAFNFIYPENIRALEQWGAVRYFSPLSDTRLPQADLLYLPGGYPEQHLEQLSANRSLLEDLRAHIDRGGKIIAECGGMMFLGKEIIDEQGKVFPMADLLDLSTTLQNKRMSLGYRTLRANGLTIRGHEFHYSQFSTPPIGRNDVQVTNVRNEPVEAPVFHDHQVFASYMHFYWGEKPTLIDALFTIDAEKEV